MNCGGKENFPRADVATTLHGFFSDHRIVYLCIRNIVIEPEREISYVAGTPLYFFSVYRDRIGNPVGGTYGGSAWEFCNDELKVTL